MHKNFKKGLNRSSLFAGLIVFSIYFTSIVAAQPIETQKFYGELQQKSQKATPLGKLDTALYQALQESLDPQTKSTAMVAPVFKMDAQNRIHVTLRVHELNDALLSQLEALEFDVEASTLGLPARPNQQSIVGWITLDRLDAIARLPTVFHIRPNYKPVINTGRVTSAGDSILQAASLRAATGITGAGQSVGVISDGVDHLNTAQASGDLPVNVTVLNNTLGCLALGTDCSCQAGSPSCDVKDEGTAMLEIVHDLAPGSDLLFSDSGNSPEQFAERIQALANAGSTVIVDDVSWFVSPYYEDGVIAQTVNSVTLNNNIVYFSSAGNQGERHYEAFFSNGGDDFHDFNGGDTGLTFTLPADASVAVFLQWNNQWGLAGDDYDLYLGDQNLQIIARSENPQTGIGDPFEFVSIVNTSGGELTLNVGVKKFAGADREFTLYLLDGAGNIEYLTTGAVNGHQAAEHCLATGAINAADPGNDDIAFYSNQGPSRVFNYDGAGNPISPIQRDKPDLAAIDGVFVSGAGGFGGTDPNGSNDRLFFGTSAAAPHAAAVAALLRSAAPQLSAVQVAQTLRNTALDLGAGGFDFDFGSGRVDALAAVQQACPECFQSTGNNTRMINLSTLGFVDNLGMAAGFIVQGPNPRRFVILAERFNSSIDATLQVTDLSGNTVFASNDDWQDHSTASEVQATLGRAPGSIRDAALAVTLSQGVYVARMRSISGVGDGIVAINDLSNSDPGGTRMINLSTLGFVDNLGMAAGFIVQGPNPRRFVILAERFNSSIDATLQVTDLSGNTVFASNDDWQDHSTASEVQATLGRAPGSIRDAALAVTLSQGVYVARMRSISGVGDGIVAINDL